MTRRPHHPDIPAILARLDCLLADLAPDLRDGIDQCVGQLARLAEQQAKHNHYLAQEVDFLRLVADDLDVMVRRKEKRIAKLRGRVEGERHRAYLAAIERSVS